MKYAQDAVGNIEGMNMFMKDDHEVRMRERLSDDLLQVQSAGYQGNTALRKQFAGGLLSRRWSRRMELGEAYRTPSHFTWRY